MAGVCAWSVERVARVLTQSRWGTKTDGKRKRDRERVSE